jgi:hypothetical protein
MSYANANPSLVYYSIFGYVITALLLIKYLLKALWLVPLSPEMGDILPQFLALKSPAFIVYPTYF